MTPNTFRLRGGAVADKLYPLLAELGIPNTLAVQVPDIEFVTSCSTIAHPKAKVVILLATKTQNNRALDEAEYMSNLDKRWERFPLIVDETGDQRDVNIRTLRRWLFDEIK